MDSINNPRPPRQAVLVLSYPDGHLELYGEKNIDAHLARVPVASSAKAERQAEEVTKMLLPRRYRDLYRADRLRRTGTTRPLRPSVLKASLEVQEILRRLNSIADGSQSRREVCAWTL